jgi:hypothetical protein
MSERAVEIARALGARLEALVDDAISRDEAKLPADLIETRTSLALAMLDQAALQEALLAQAVRQRGTLQLLAAALAAVEEAIGRPLALPPVRLEADAPDEGERRP